MEEFIDVSVFDELAAGQKNAQSVVDSLVLGIERYLGLKPYYNTIKVEIGECKANSDNIFDLGVSRKIENHKISLLLAKENEEFFPFILLREVFNGFIPPEIRTYEVIQLTINRIITFLLSKHKLEPEWDELVREKVEKTSQLSTGWRYLLSFDRLINFFKISHPRFNAIPFFFRYIRENSTLLSEKIETREFDIHALFHEEFEPELVKDLRNDELIEAISCVFQIFTVKKRFKSLLSYRQYFQEFKKEGQLKTELSLRKFITYMDWMKNSVLAPSYHINYAQFALACFEVKVRFNPLLRDSTITKILEEFPFLFSVTICQNSFSAELTLFFITPIKYREKAYAIFRRLQEAGYILGYQILLYNASTLYDNANLRREYSYKKRLVDRNNSFYKESYEWSYVREFGDTFQNQELTLLDFLVLERIQWYSVSGFGFEKSAEQLRSIKKDLLHEIVSEHTQIKNLRELLTTIHESKEYLQEVQALIEKYKKFGIFYLRHKLDDRLAIHSVLQEYLMSHPEIQNIAQFQTILKKYPPVLSLETNILFYRIDLVNELLTSYFTSKQEYSSLGKKLKQYSDLFSLFSCLHLFDLDKISKILASRQQIDSIYKKEEEVLNQSHEYYKPYEITSQKIEEVIDKFFSTTPPAIVPALINTLPLRTKLQGGDHMIFRIFRSLENQKRLDTVSHIFGMSNVVSDIDIQTGTRYITVLLYNPLFSSEEKKIIASILYSLFKDELENLYCSYSLGYSPAFSLKHYYDFEAKEFSYTEDLFDHYFRFIMKTFDSSNENIIPAKKRIPYQSMYKIWDQDYDVTEFVRKVNRRAADEKVEEFGIHADPLSQFQSNLLDCLLDTDKYRKQKSADFFKNYIKSIKFIPAFNKFGFGQYYLYIHPADLNKIDFKLLFLNSFQSVRHAVKLDTSLSFLMKYVMPYENPNLAYLNRITKSDKIIQEYCLFSIKKVHYIFQFYYNLTPEGWVYDKNKFKKYMQNILFNPSYDVHIPKMTTYELSKAPSVYGPDSSEYEVLTRIYTTRSLDIKSYLGTSRRSYIEDITTLLKNGCIFPYLSLTHLDLHNIIRIIIPNIPEESKETIIKIFSYFNYGFIYEIEGKYFIHGLPEEVSFEEGLFLKLYFPLCTLYEFFTLFKQLFEYLNVPHYLILTDFCKGDILLENVYGDKDALKSYNPLKNLIWNEKDKKWMNHKLYTEKFEPIYPDLFYNERE